MSITWLFGNSGAGKTTLARELVMLSCQDKDKNLFENSPYYDCVWLDGDNLRGIWTDLKFSKEDRWEQNMRVARLAKMLDDQGFNVVVSVICPYKKLRAEVKKITDCKFIYVEGGKIGRDYPFDYPKLY